MTDRLRRALRDPLFFLRKDKRIGSAQGKRLYDLPLNRSTDTGFLMLLIALMTFLAALALMAGFALSAISARWSAGLDNKATIEIPAEKNPGGVRSREEIAELVTQVTTMLEAQDSVIAYEVMEREDIEELIEPWLGEAGILGEVPVPALISVSIEQDDIEPLRKSLKSIDKDIQLATHENWLGDVLRLTGALQVSALFIALIIGATTVTAIAGAVRSRMAIHQADIELLHLMGASDAYISRQFQRHALIMAFKGGLAGMLAGLIIAALISLIAGDTGEALLPDFQFSWAHYLVIFALPVLACVIAAITARYTVLRVLAEMP